MNGLVQSAINARQARRRAEGWNRVDAMAAVLNEGEMHTEGDEVTIDDLDTRYREANWLIAKRSCWAMAKALTLGSESL
jgi:hypothetical protein